MLTRFLLVLAVSAAMLLPSTAVAAPPPEDYVPTFLKQDRWFHANTGLVGNVDAREQRYVRWDDQKPTGAVHAVYHGNNFGRYANGDHDARDLFTATGTFTGDLDTIAFEMYFYGWAQSTIGCGLSLSFDFRIDGQTILLQDYEGSAGIYYQQVSDTLVVARFALTNIWEASKLYDLPYGPDVVHDVYVNVQNFYVCNETTWVYDSAGAPSGMVANLERPGRKGYFEIDVLNPPPPLSSGA